MLAKFAYANSMGSQNWLSMRSQFLGNWSRHSSVQDAENHLKNCRLIVSVLRLLWRYVGSCEFREKAFPSAWPLLNWLLCRVHCFLSVSLIFSFRPFIVNVLQWPTISSRLSIIFSRSLNTVKSYTSKLSFASLLFVFMGFSLTSIGVIFMAKH